MREDDGPSALLRTYESTLMLVDAMEDPAGWPHVGRGFWERVFDHQLELSESSGQRFEAGAVA